MKSKSFLIAIGLAAVIIGPIAIPTYLSWKKHPTIVERVFITEQELKDDVVTDTIVNDGNLRSDLGDNRSETDPGTIIYVIGEPASIARKRVRELDARFLRDERMLLPDQLQVDEESFWDQFKKPNTSKSTEK